MGEFVNSGWLKILAWTTPILILVLNLKLIADFFGVTALLAK
jgi:Mn2+/Fe2+ NRAMP family transporter